MGLSFVFSPVASAQQVFGGIFGTVTDANGGVIPNAKVTITDIAKGTTFELTTDGSGSYNKGQLIPDEYRVTIQATGFQKVVSSPLQVRVDDAARFDATLAVGDVTTEVEVTAAAPLLQSDRADVAQTFSAKEIDEYPNIGRNLQSMELVNPGTAKMGWQHASDENPQGSVQMVVNGQLFSAMGYELDGTTNQDPILGIIVINPNFDSVSEVKQATQNFDAEFSYVGGGLASYSTRSGTNEIHGDAFEYLQLNTPGFTTFTANPFVGIPAATYRQNQFGGSIGGRVIKDKLFFFGDAQLNRQSQGGSILTSVPTALNRTGNFSDWLANNSIYEIFDPHTGDPNTGVGRSPYQNNTIPPSQLSPQAQKILAFFPLPNTQQIAGQPFVNNYAANGAIAITGNAWDTREDYYLNEKNSIFGRYSYQGFTEVGPGAFGEQAGGPAFGNYAGNSVASNQSIAIGWTRTISPTLINEFRFGWMRYHVFDVPNGYGTQPAADAGIPGLNLDKTYTSGMPFFDVSAPNNDYRLGYALNANQCNCPLTQTEKQIQFIDNLSWTRGKHNFKFGADLRYAQNLRVPSDSHRAGELYINGDATGNVGAVGDNPTPGIGLATFLLGEVTSFQRYVSTSTNASENQPRYFWYGQDTWRPTPKWTITAGLRWEMIFPESVNAAGNGATFDLSNGLMYVFGVGGVSSHGIQTMNWHNFAPRAGIAYQLNNKTVLRAGYGWGYDVGVFGSNFGHNVSQNVPVLAQQNINNNATPFTDVFTLAQGPSQPSPITVGSNGTFPLPNGINPRFRPATVTLPTTYLYNAALQYQVNSRVAVTGAYVGNSNRHGFIGQGQTINPNEQMFVPNSSPVRPYAGILPFGNDLQYFCSCSNEHYDSFQGQVKINAWAGWTLQGSYTYQTQWGPGWGYDSNYYFIYDRPAGNGYSNSFPHNQITIAQAYDIPFGRGKKYGSSINKFADYAVGGWAISGVMTYYSGFPFSPSLDNYPGQPNTGPNNRPNKGSGDPYAGAAGNRSQWFVGGLGTTFLAPGAQTFGTYPINTLIGPRFIQQDLTLSKSFKITERVSFRLRTDAANAFNHTNLGGPNGDVQASNAGQITGIAAGGSMRRLQFSGTVSF
ncbi:MAG: TonB-dependent receptor [Acidobacteriia bacterium]|nr:TonB-dependent receptor [Terriglobia bacterium]